MGILIENCRAYGRDARSIFIDGAVIASISADETQPVPSGTLKMDAKGGTVLPGLADSHCHPFDVGSMKRNLDLRGVINITSLRLRLAARVSRTPPGEWILGGGWDQEALAEGRMPNREDVDDVSPENPVILSRVCGHIALVNGPAILSLGIDGAEGPEYQRANDGSLTGIILERALVQAYTRLPRPSVLAALADFLDASRDAERMGLTTLHCILSQDDYVEELDALSMLLARGGPGPNLRLYLPPGAIGKVEDGKAGGRFDGMRMRVNGIKIFADGSLGARTAALREPYSDDRTNNGLLRYGDAELAALVEKVDSLGFQVVVHAIGDRAIDQTVAAFSNLDSVSRKRHRIEHASLAPRDLRGKMVKLGIRAAVQPSFVVSDSWAEARLGEERLKDLYPFASMAGEGIVISGSSDAPVETLSPIIGMWAACTRRANTADERLSLAEAIRIYTINVASNGLDEKGYGLSEASRAELTVLDSDVTDMHPAMFRKVGVAATVTGGELTYSYEGIDC